MSESSRDKWNARHREAADREDGPSRVLERLRTYLPASGRALDVAGGRGRHALWLAARGLDVTLCDISDVGLEVARRRARQAGLPLRTVQVDLERDGLPPGPWDLIVSVLYLWRPLIAAAAARLAPGGRLIVIQPSTRNLERHAKPPVRFLLAPGELPRLARDLECLHHEEDWLEDGRHDAVLVARRPTTSNSVSSPTGDEKQGTPGEVPRNKESEP